MGSLETKPAAANYSIDIIRFFAIAMVILLHCSGFPYHFTNPQITSIDIVNWFTTDVYAAFGMLGVPLFVMLTGALLLNPNRENEPLRVFYRKRLDRIALPFIFWTIIYFAWSFTILGKPFTLTKIGEGLLGGSYAHLWYLYLLMGLYALTPVLRVLVKHLDRKLFTYLLVLWFAGTIATPIIHNLTSLNYFPYTFIVVDWVGYFLIGAYLLETEFPRSKAILIASAGVIATIVGEWLLTGTMGEKYTGFLHSYVSPTVMVASIALFFVLISWDSNRLASHTKLGGVIHWVSQNTLPIYLIHMLVLVSLWINVGGIWLNSMTFSPLFDVPIYAAIVFAVSAGLVYVLKKIPLVKRLVG